MPGTAYPGQIYPGQYYPDATAAPPATPGAPWYLWVGATPKLQFELEEDARRPDHSLLHRYRTGFQTVGQSYRLWPPPAKADQTIEPDEQRADHNLLHRYRVGYQTVGQPLAMRARSQQRLDDLEFEIPRQIGLEAFRKVAAVAPPSTARLRLLMGVGQ